uniref:ELK domain-containing protein n=1 Tax=Monopterus albus TaxID=43700 RepID=A0A3Q3K048_MONAL
MDEDERQRKLEAGRAKLASFRQKRAKSNSTGAAKKTQKRKGQTVSQNDSATQDCHVKPGPPSTSDTEQSRKSNNESPVEELREEELLALTGQDQLKQLQQAVEKRNEIIAKLSSNLQEALASRDQVQLEAQSLAGQIQALQRQLQQASAGRNANLNHKEAPSEGSGTGGPGSHSSVEGSIIDSDTETDSVLHKLQTELEEERENNQRLCAELAEEMEKHQHVLSLLEKEKRGREEEQKEKECLEIEQYKEEKDKLNREVLELRKRLQEEEDSERRFSEEVASSTLHLQSLEDKRLRQEEEMKRLKEEVARVRQLLEEREKELKYREEEVIGLKTYKNQQNQAKAGFSCDERTSIDKANLESGTDQDSMNRSIPGDLMMERYLSSIPVAHSQSSVVSESFERCSQLDVLADCRLEKSHFELNSEVLGDEPLLSISNRAVNENDNLHNISTPQCFVPVTDNSNPQSVSQWLHNSASDNLEMSELSEEQCEDADLEKELLNQQCGELREELALKDRDMNVLREEIIRSAEELEEARSRWAQVTEELRQALWELEEEKEKRRHIEEEINSKAHVQDDLNSKHSAFIEEREMFMGKEAAETLLLVSDASLSEQDNKMVWGLEEEAALLSQQKLLVSSLHEINQSGDSAKRSPVLRYDNQLQLEETKTKLKTTSDQLGQRSVELDKTFKELEATRAQVLNLEKSHDSLDRAEKQEHELESQMFCLRQNLANLEEAQAQAVQEREEHKRKEEEMDERIKKMEQVLEEELEQFENLLKSKDVELAEEKEKWEEERQEKEKELLDIRHLMEEQQREREAEMKALLEKQVWTVEETMERLKKSHQQEIKDLIEKHQQEVTEREHARMVSELTIKHSEELSQLRTELSQELRESMEAAHQAELQQAQAQKALELEALRLSLTSVHKSQLEHSQLNLQQEQESALTNVQTSLRETFALESALMQAHHQSELDQIRQQNQEQHERLCELHQREMGESRLGSVVFQFISVFFFLLSYLPLETQKSIISIQAELTQTSKLLSEAQAAVLLTQSELQDSRARLEELQAAKEQSQKLEEELKQAWADRDAAAREFHPSTNLPTCPFLLKQSILHLQEEKDLLKQSSEQEVGQLWTQLESMRTSRQELGELKEQLLVRSSRVDDIERLKTEFSEQKRVIKEQNEAELESLRRYFEQQLRATEESHREEITLLQLRLVEGALEESVFKTANVRYVNIMSCLVQEFLDSLCLQLEEKHTMELANLRSSLALSFKEEVQQVRSDLTDHYYEELQEMKTCHALELEQFRAKLSDSHLQGTCPYFRPCCSLYSFQLLQLKQEFAVELEDALKEDRERLQAEMKRLREELEEKHQAELYALRSDIKKETEKVEHLEAQGHKILCLYWFSLEERAALELHLGQKYEISLAELKNKHQAELEYERATLLKKHSQEMDTLNAKLKEQLDSLSASHGDQLTAIATELESKHNAELVALEAALNSKRKADLDSLLAVFQETSRAKLEDLAAELIRKHKEEMDEQEKRMLGNMDMLEATYLKEIQVRRCSSEKQMLEDLRKELAQVHMEKFSAMASELSHVELAVQKEALDTEHCNALERLKKQVFTQTSLHCFGLLLYNLDFKCYFGSCCLSMYNCPELRGISARELEACRRELEESSSRQRQHFIEEVELLKVQSEERLQDRINQLKCEEQKERELDDLRQSFTSEQGEKERSYTAKMSQLTAQLQQLDTVVAQVLDVGCLQGELEGKRAEMETLDTLLQRRERESQEGGTIKIFVWFILSIGISVTDLSSEDLELTQLLCESLLVSDSQMSPGGEEAALNACSRLHHTIDTLLELLNQANTQLAQTHDVHLSLEEKFSQGREDTAQLIEQHKRLLEQLDQEAKLKSQLQLELHKAEGLIEGYVAEKAALEESLQQKESQEERLVEELEDLKELDEEHAILLRQKEHLSAGLGEREKVLLAETECLAREKLDLQRQAEKDLSSLSQRLRVLERELEEQETKDLETELHYKTNTEDLNQHVHALEKQLKHNRQFIEEQAVEREHERDEFQQEIRRLEAQLRLTASVDNKGHTVESLQAVIKDKTEDHASLLTANQEAQRDLSERNEEIDKLAGRIRELEQALLSTAEHNRSIGQLEQELHRAKLREQELTQDKQALEQQQLSNRLQISALQSKLDETRHCYHDSARDPTQELREALDTAQQNLQSKEQEVCKILCNTGVAKIILDDLSIKEAELKHLTLQLELLTSQNAAHVNELQEQIAVLKETEEETLPSALLQEKNQEIDHLSIEIQRLEQELENTRNSKALEVELEDLRSQVEHLQSEITRVRQDKEEEEERLHEVISTLQAELATLGPNVHEVSDSQDGDSINPSPAPSPEPQHYAVQEQERRGEPNSLKQELSLTHSASSRSLRSCLKTLQSQLDTVVAEKEALERLLLTQEEEYRGHGEEFGMRLKTQRERADELQGLLTLKEAELEEVKTQAQEEEEKRKLYEEERDTYKIQAQETSTLHEEKTHLSSLVMELQKKEQERLREIDLRAEVTDREELVSEERAKIKTLETVKEELYVEREALRRREVQLQEEIERLRQEAASMKALIQDLTVQLSEKETSQEEAQKEVLAHAEAALAKADIALRQKETELIQLREEHQALVVELTAVKQGLSTSTERAEKLHEEGQTKERALVDLETDNQRLKAELRHLQEDLTAQEEELAYQKQELQQLRQHCQQQDTLDHQHRCSQKASLSSPEVLRKLECSEDRIPERFHTSALGSHLSELSVLNNTGLDIPQLKHSPRVVMEPSHSRTITPDPATQSTHPTGSLSVSDNFSVLDSLDADKVHELEELDLTAPSSPLGSTSSLSAAEWASDGYGSNVSSELGARLRVELEQTERLDAQFVEYLRCRGMNPTVNTDSAAGSMSYSDDFNLILIFTQFLCRILTLSQRRYHSGDSSTLPDHRNESSCNPPMSWQQEKRALQETVIALRELLCRMAQRQTQVSLCFLMNTLQASLQTGQVESQLKTELEESQKQLRSFFFFFFFKSLNDNPLLPVQAVQLSSEQQRSEVMALKGQVEQERVACSNLRRELQIEQSRSRLLAEAESRLAEIHSKLADAHGKLEEERARCTRQVDELSHRYEADAARDRKFITDMRAQLEQERKQGEELAAVMDKLRAELLQSRRKWEEEDRTRREELQSEQEAATRHRVALETLKEQKQEACRALEVERERSRLQVVELTELKERLRQLKDKEREREKQWERERRKGRQEQTERERQQERISNKLHELELLRQQDQHRMQELQHTLADLEREEREMAAQRLSCQATQQHKAAVLSMSSPSSLLDRLLKENSELTERMTSLSQERATLKHRLTFLERQLRHTENELAKVTETENGPISDVTSNGKVVEHAAFDARRTVNNLFIDLQVQRIYERYLRAESFRKALVYQKRYLLLLLGGFHECEQATLCLIARMGVQPSPPISSRRKPLGRFRAAVRVVIAVSRMRFLTRKWQKAIRKYFPSEAVNGHAPAEVLKQQQPKSNSNLPLNRETVSALVPPSKSPFRLHNRAASCNELLSFFRSFSSTTLDPERSLTEYIHHLEKVQQRLVGARQGEKH